MKNALLALAALMLAVSPTHAQIYTALYNFDGTHGAYPAYPDILAQGRDGNLYGTAPDGGLKCQPTGCGVVFRITQGGTLSVLHDFDAIQGSGPNGGLTLAADGSLYGTTAAGASGFGTIFRGVPGGSGEFLHTFGGGADGGNPWAPLIQGSDGNFYGTTTYSDIAYRITRSGTFTSLASLPGPSYAPLLQASDGNFYGTTIVGGDLNCQPGGCGTVFKITPNGIAAIVHAFKNNDGANLYAPVVEGGDGNLYGTALLGGAYAHGVVFKITPQGGFTVLHNFPDPNYPYDGIDPYASLVPGSDGNLYGVTSMGGTNTFWGVMFQITPAGDYSILHDFDYTDGAEPQSTPVQHTNGTFYGLTSTGGTSKQGVVYSFDMGLPPFVRLVSTSGKVGQTGGVLGQGFTGTTNVSFNGISAVFTVVSDTYLTATVPPGANTGFVTVVTPSETLTSNQEFRVRP